ncbi:MAG TPA: protein kinase [Gemmatimonadales bacterium]
MTQPIEQLKLSLADRYTIDRELGQGGMATVYLAHDIKHDRDVAIKVLHPDLGAALGAERFLSEIRTTARLQHPHILPLLDSGDAGGLLYYVMPYVAGETLRGRLSRERVLPIPDSVRIATEVADALSAAHALGIIHRDIKPENILLQGGHALVADFGIALAVQHAGGQRMTQTGLSLGTPQYMSPEQAMGEKTIDARSDIYALGAVTYEMLAGDPPFTGSSVQAIVAKVMTEKPTPIHTVRDTVPPGVEDAVLTALAKLPADRFATAAEFSAALASTGARPSATRRPSSGSMSPRNPTMMLAAIAVIALIVAAAGWLRPVAPRQQVTRVAMAFPTGEEPHPLYYGFAVAVSPDGSQLAYVGPGATANKTQLWIRHLDALNGTPVPGTTGTGSVEWSPDGRSILIGVSGGTGLLSYVVTANGGQVVPLAGAREATWGASGAIYYAPRGGKGIIIRREVSGRLDTLLKPRADTGYSARPLTIFPDESGMLYVPELASPDDTTPLTIKAISFSTGKSAVVETGVFGRVLPSGQLLRVTSDGDVFIEPFDVKRLQVTGRGTLVTRVALGSNSGNRVYPQLSVGNDGTMIYLTGAVGRQQLIWLDGDGRRAGATDIAGFLWGLSLSPDGSHVAFSEGEGMVRGPAWNQNVWVEDLRTAARTRLTASATNLRPTWSSDGKDVLWARIGGPEKQSLDERPADASAPERMILSRAQFGHSVGDGRWLPDHHALMVSTYGDEATARDIYSIVAGGGAGAVPLVVMPDNQTSGVPSPDGSIFAYLSDEGGTPELYVQPLTSTGARLRISNGGASSGRWSRDGRTLYYWDERGKLLAVSIQSKPTLAVTGTREINASAVLSTAGGSNTGLYDVAPDGRILMAEDVRGSYEVILVRNWLAGVAKEAP